MDGWVVSPGHFRSDEGEPPGIGAIAMSLEKADFRFDQVYDVLDSHCGTGTLLDWIRVKLWRPWLGGMPMAGIHPETPENLDWISGEWVNLLGVDPDPTMVATADWLVQDGTFWTGDGRVLGDWRCLQFTCQLIIAYPGLTGGIKRTLRMLARVSELFAEPKSALVLVCLSGQPVFGSGELEKLHGPTFARVESERSAGEVVTLRADQIRDCLRALRV